WTVGVDGGDTGSMLYTENVNLKSGIRLIGSGAETSIINGNGSGSVLTLNGVTDVEITGFTITNGGSNSSDAGVLVTGASNNITLTYNIIGGYDSQIGSFGNDNAGVVFQSSSSGSISFNTVVHNVGSGVVVDGSDSWLNARYNIIALNDVGFDNRGGGQIFNRYNLLFNTDSSWCSTCQNYAGTVAQGLGERTSDPMFANAGHGDYRLTTSSRAMDAIPASEYLAAPNGGGSKADMGYRELLAVPATLLLGKEGNSCGLG
ncbi:MAG: hypothetical protein GY764_06495, partial [Halieaceae bacterium]|nr:hypothetical protein [Halieaceae bacterium]